MSAFPGKPHIARLIPESLPLVGRADQGGQVPRTHRETLLTVLLLLTLSGCGSGIDVSTRTLAEARRVWDKAGITSYNLEWTTTGARAGHYRVYVRDGEVKSVLSVDADAKTRAAHPADPSYYGVDGLFRVLDEELDECLGQRPFGQMKNARILQRFLPDPVYGYPRRYRRDVAGSRQGLALDVIAFDPSPPPEIPPPDLK